VANDKHTLSALDSKPRGAGLRVAESTFLKSQLVAIFEAIIASGMNPREFEWTVIKSPFEGGGDNPRLEHKPSGFFCEFYFHSSGARATKFSPSDAERIHNTGSVDWTTQLSLVKNWLSYVKREIEAPDVWGVISQENAFIESANDQTNDNSPFTPDEKAQVLSTLQEIKNYLLTAHQLDPELVDARFKYLEGALDRVGRVDWKNLLLSTIIGILISSSVSPEIAHNVLRHVAILIREIITYKLLTP
jgi:hypothetical protein